MTAGVVETHQTVTVDDVDVHAVVDTFAELSETAGARGVTRLGYTRLERRAHEVFTDRMLALGLRVWTDDAGNTIAEKAGTVPSAPAIGTGSHLDSVPSGGRFDGVAGVAAAMEIARIMCAKQIAHRHPFRFVAFATEEGARFGQACIGSRLAAGLSDSASLAGLVDQDGVSAADAMAAVGLDPTRVDSAQWRPTEWLAFVELHIEQSATLAARELPLGIVDTISGSTRLEISVRGRSSHTGGTPMYQRADALAAASQIVLTAEAMATDDRHRGTRITVGRLLVEPGSITTIPGLCTMSVDIRDVDTDRQRDSAAELIARAESIASDRGVAVSCRLLADASPVVMPRSVRDVIVAAADSLGVDYRVMASGASHDCQMISRVCPTGLIFVPSRNGGVSHTPEELSTPEDLDRGAVALGTTLLMIDATPSEVEPPEVLSHAR